MRKLIACVCVTGCATTTAPRPMRLERVILYQNGIGYFERYGHVRGDTLQLQFARGELDDVLKTLTVIDRLGAAVATVDVPLVKDADRSVGIGVRLSAGRVHDLAVSYAVPTPTWKAAYRVVLDDKAGGLLQGWAMVNNVSQEDWNGIALTLATGAPMSLALDLHTPEYVKRPDATGRLVAPTLLGPVDNEKTTAGDRDGDGIPDAVDRCPDAAEDRDGFEDADGCPDPDQDRDHIPDAVDKCPNEPETYNGFEDDDGCPDRGRVVVTSTSIEVLDQIFFGENADGIQAVSLPIVDAIAATLRGNPEIAKVEVGGHASEDESDVWGLSSRRAAAVRAALVARGVAGDRLEIVPYGATRPLDHKAATKNRRVDFVIAARHDIETQVDRRATPGYDVPHAVRAVHAASKPADVAGSVRYALTEPVTIRRGAATMVSILNKPIASEDVLLFRPDANAPSSDRHPFRAVRLVNTSGYTLEPGPIAIFARGSFVGDTLLDRLDLDETAWVPYALEGGTTVTSTTDDREQPVRIVAIHRGVVTVENAGIHTTRYHVAVGREPPKQLFVRHDKHAGYAARELPPKTEDRGDSYLVPMPLQAGKASELAIEEREPRRRTIELLDAGSTQLGLYVEGSKLPHDIAAKLAAALELRKALGALEDDRAQLRTRIGDLAARAEELRQSLRALDKVRGADDLRKKLVASLTDATANTDALARALEVKTEELAAARGRLQDALRDITLDES